MNYYSLLLLSLVATASGAAILKHEALLPEQLTASIKDQEPPAFIAAYNKLLTTTPDKEGLKREFAAAWAERIRTQHAEGERLRAQGKKIKVASAIGIGGSLASSVVGGSVMVKKAWDAANTVRARNIREQKQGLPDLRSSEKAALIAKLKELKTTTPGQVKQAAREAADAVQEARNDLQKQQTKRRNTENAEAALDAREFEYLPYELHEAASQNLGVQIGGAAIGGTLLVGGAVGGVISGFTLKKGIEDSKKGELMIAKADRELALAQELGLFEQSSNATDATHTDEQELTPPSDQSPTALSASMEPHAKALEEIEQTAAPAPRTTKPVAAKRQNQARTAKKTAASTQSRQKSARKTPNLKRN
jgi:hypothetical protein